MADRFSLTNALLTGTKEDVTSQGVTIIEEQPIGMHCGVYVYGSEDEYEQETVAIDSGENPHIPESEVEAGDIVIYGTWMDESAVALHLGKVLVEDGNIWILSKIMGSPYVIKHAPEQPPIDYDEGEIDTYYVHR